MIESIFEMWGYTEIYLSYKSTKDIVDQYDVDTLIDEISNMQYMYEDSKEIKKLRELSFKHHANVELEESEIKFIKEMLILHECQLCYSDELEEEDEL